MTQEELEKASVEDLLDSLDYCGYDSYYASYREIIIIEIKNRLEENERLKQELLTYKNAICNKECAEVWGESERLKEENEQLKSQIEKMKSAVKGNIKWAEQNKNELMRQKLCSMLNQWEVNNEI